MAKYKGTVELIGGLTPKNGGSFPLMTAHDIQVDDEDKRLDAALEELFNREGQDATAAEAAQAAAEAAQAAAEAARDAADTSAQEAAERVVEAYEHEVEAATSATAAQAAQAGAEAAETGAGEKATEATQAAQEATTAASTAKTHATTATQKATAAATSATTAGESAATAKTHANTATQKATAAATSATTAGESATAAQAAQEAAETAQGKAETAATTATSKASAAATSANTATSKASAAATSATAAQTAQAGAEAAQAATEAAKAEVEEALANGDFKGDPGTPGATGATGEAGYTPVRGVDYWTAEDIAAMTADNRDIIMDELAKRNQITIPLVTSTEAMTDPAKLYIMDKDGEFWYYASVTVLQPAEPLFTNVLPLAIDTDGSIFNGKGYKDGYRTNSTGAYVESAANSVTGYIACKNGDFVRMRGIPYASSNNQVIPYKTDFTKYGNPQYGSTTWTVLDNGDITFTVGLATSTGYFNVSAGTPFEKGAIITLNEEIAYSEPAEAIEWSPMQPVVFSDFTDDINALKKTTTDHEIRLDELERKTEGDYAGDLTEEEKVEKIRVWNKTPRANLPPVVLLDASRNKEGILNKSNIPALYAAYDALMTAYPQYVTKTLMGQDAGGTYDIYRYDFEAPKPHPNSDSDNPDLKKLTGIFISGIHFEWTGAWALYYAMEEIVTNPAFRALRQAAHFIVLPVTNPYCMDINNYPNTGNGRQNANGVEIHRNFAVDHAVIDSSSDNYGGAAPLSEVESQYIDRVMRENQDAAFFVSCHNFNAGGGTQYGTTFIWPSTATNYLYDAGGRFGVAMSSAWEAKYGDVWRDYIDAAKTEKQPDGDYTVVLVGRSRTPGSEAKHAMKYGIQGATVEVCADCVALGTTAGDTVTMTRGAEVYANLANALFAEFDPADKTEQYK